MTPEEIQRTIEGMLSVQQELQRSQLEFRESLIPLRDDIVANKEAINELRMAISDLKEISQRHERRLEQLIGYSITGESDRLDLLQRLQNVERRVNRLENNNDVS